VISPLNQLLYHVGNSATVRNVLGLGTADYPLPSDLDLTKYSASASLAEEGSSAVAGQVRAAFLRLLALEEAAQVFAAPPGTPDRYNNFEYLPGGTANQRIAGYIRENPTRSLANADGIAAFLRSLRPTNTGYRNDVIERAATLVQAFNKQRTRSDVTRRLRRGSRWSSKRRCDYGSTISHRVTAPLPLKTRSWRQVTSV
jgi:hypothetical protein